MTNKIYFTLEESVYHPGKYIININHNLLPEIRTEGSFSLLFARLMSLSYAQFLRFCRDEIEAEVVGKNSLYPVPYFKRTAKTLAFVRLLNKRMNFVMWEREHPDWKEHAEYVQKKKEEQGYVSNS